MGLKDCGECKHCFKPLQMMPTIWQCKLSFVEDTAHPGEYLHGTDSIFCDHRRNSPADACGPEGKLWEPKINSTGTE